MTISQIGVNNSATTQVHFGHHGRMGTFKAVSSLFGMSAQDIAKEVKSGKSLDDIAKEKGISHADLLAALKAGAPAAAKSDPNFDAKIEALSTQKGMPGRSKSPDNDGDNDGSGTTGVVSGNITGSQKSTLDALSSLLGTSSSDLLSKLQTGTSLTSLLDAKGVTLAQVGNALQSGFLVDTKI